MTYILAGLLGLQGHFGVATAHAVQINSSGEAWNQEALHLMVALECTTPFGCRKFSHCCPRHSRSQEYQALMAVEVVVAEALVALSLQPKLRKPAQSLPRLLVVYLCGDNVVAKDTQARRSVSKEPAHTLTHGILSAFREEGDFIWGKRRSDIYWVIYFSRRTITSIL